MGPRASGLARLRHAQRTGLVGAYRRAWSAHSGAPGLNLLLTVRGPLPLAGAGFGLVAVLARATAARRRAGDPWRLVSAGPGWPELVLRRAPLHDSQRRRYPSRAVRHACPRRHIRATRDARLTNQ